MAAGVGAPVELIVFYSWQSDLPNNVSRGFIERAIEKAISELKGDHATLVPRLDQDTAGVPGAPAIDDTIFAKIASSHVFVADISIVTEGGGRPCPNPNVLLELGYAAGKLGWERVILVCNAEYGKLEALPFDLRPRRVLRFSATVEQTDDERRAERERLSKEIRRQLRSIADLLTSDECSREGEVNRRLDDLLAGVRQALAGRTSVNIVAGARGAIPGRALALSRVLVAHPPDRVPASARARHEPTLAALERFRGRFASLEGVATRLDERLRRAIRRFNHSKDIIAINDGADLAYLIGRELGFKDEEILPEIDMPPSTVEARFAASRAAMSANEEIGPLLAEYRKTLEEIERAVEDLARCIDDPSAVDQ